MGSCTRHAKSVKASTSTFLGSKNQHKKRVNPTIFEFAKKNSVITSQTIKSNIWFHKTCTYIGWNTSMVSQTSRKGEVLTADAKNLHICANYAGRWICAYFCARTDQNIAQLCLCTDDSCDGRWSCANFVHANWTCQKLCWLLMLYAWSSRENLCSFCACTGQKISTAVLIVDCSGRSSCASFVCTQPKN